MDHYLEIFVAGYEGYARYLWHEITNPHWKNYFYWLIGVSAFFFLLEVTAPWRRDQARSSSRFEPVSFEAASIWEVEGAHRVQAVQGVQGVQGVEEVEEVRKGV